jgi:hypothetical protein
VCALGHQSLVPVLTRCGLPLPVYFLVDEKHSRCLVVYLHLTDNSEVGKFGKIVSFRHRERGPHHGTAPVVLPTPPGRSRVDLPPHACLVA